MKTLFYATLILLLVTNTFAQSFTLGSTDSSSDATQPLSPDAKSVSYAFNATQDSLWFKIEFYKKVSNKSWNVKIGLDANGNLSDGANWAGANQSLKFDLLIDVYYNPGFPPPFFGNILDANSLLVTGGINSMLIDTSTLVIGVKYSLFKQTTHPLRFVIGTGIVAGLVNDDVPDNSFITIQEGTTTGFKTHAISDFVVYPNPNNGLIFIKNIDESKNLNNDYKIIDTEGKVLLSGRIEVLNPYINIQKLNYGNYILQIIDDKGFSSYKVTFKL